MSTEETKKLARTVMERLDRRDVKGVIECANPDAVWHGFAPVALDNAGYGQAIMMFLNAYPDSRFPVEDIVAEGDRAAVRHSLVGTQTQPFGDIPASGKPVRVNAIVVFRVKDGKVAETWLNADMLGMMQQIGVVPAGAA